MGISRLLNVLDALTFPHVMSTVILSLRNVRIRSVDLPPFSGLNRLKFESRLKEFPMNCRSQSLPIMSRGLPISPYWTTTDDRLVEAPITKVLDLNNEMLEKANKNQGARFE